MKTKILMGVFSLLFTIQSLAQLTIKNSTSKPIEVCLGWYQQSVSYTGYMTEGWWTIEPGETVNPGLSFTDDEDFFYFYARYTDLSGFWEGDKKLLTSSNAFNIKNADKQYVKDDNPEYQWKLFRRKDVTFGLFESRQYTLDLTAGDSQTKKVISKNVYELKSESYEVTITLDNYGNNDYHILYDGGTTYSDCPLYLDADGVYSDDTKKLTCTSSDGCQMVFSFTAEGDLKSISITDCEEYHGVGCGFPPVGTIYRKKK